MFLVSRPASVLTAYAAALGLLALSAPARAQSPTLTPRSAPTAAESGIVVMPFENLSGQPDDAWIGAGIAETVTIAPVSYTHLTLPTILLV